MFDDVIVYIEDLLYWLGGFGMLLLFGYDWVLLLVIFYFYELFVCVVIFYFKG